MQVTLALGALLISLASLGVSLGKVVWDALNERTNKRDAYFQHFLVGAAAHNWKFLEYRNVPGVHPNIDNTLNLDERSLAQRIVLFDHLGILWSMYLHRHVLHREDIESSTLWAKSWFKESEPQLRLVLDKGDLYPLDFLIWMDKDIFGGKLRPIMGDVLLDRVQKFEARRPAWWRGG